MQVTESEIRGVKLIRPKVFGDARGFFLETFNAARYAEAGIAGPFVQDNMSRSKKGIVRGLHLQREPHPQGKLVWVVEGSVLDVAVDVRVGSPTFGKWAAYTLSAEDHQQVWIPPGFAHGFAVTSESALFVYKCTDVYHPELELGVLWDDPDLGIPWPEEDALVSDKDRKHPRLRDVDPSLLPRWRP